MFSDVTSVIIAIMVELAQRMLTNLPTVPRTSDIGIWAAARSPTRAREPRTEITRPNELTISNLINDPASTMGTVVGETVKPAGSRLPQICSILVQLRKSGAQRIRNAWKIEG